MLPGTKCETRSRNVSLGCLKRNSDPKDFLSAKKKKRFRSSGGGVGGIIGGWLGGNA